MVSSRSFVAPLRRWVPHLAAVLAILACARLCLWQLDRAEEKAELLARWDSAAPLSFDQLDSGMAQGFDRISGVGRFDTERHVLLDNQTRNNHPGVHVFTPFQPLDSELLILVNRGWQPWIRRSGEWPQFDTPEGLTPIAGRLSEPPRVGVQIGRAEALDHENWPNLMTYFDLERLGDVFGDRLYPAVLLLEPGHPQHLSGDAWRTVSMGPEKHRGYAFQWASIGLAIALIWITLTLRSLRRS